jgi:hypothetical protein
MVLLLTLDSAVWMLLFRPEMLLWVVATVLSCAVKSESMALKAVEDVLKTDDKAAIDEKMRPARHFASWSAAVGENLRGVLRPGTSFDAGWGTVDIDEDDRGAAIHRLWLAWRRVAKQRRAARRRRRGW